MNRYFTVEQAMNAECTLDPIRCEHCGVIGEVTYDQAVADYYCAACGYWHNAKSDMTMKDNR